jgi:hypothetical protein
MLGDHRLWEAKPKGHKQDVKLVYYDVATSTRREKEDIFPNTIFSREILIEKHGFTPQSILEELVKKYPDEHFEVHPYSVPRRNEDINIFTDGHESFVVWHVGDRDKAKDIEFYLKKDPAGPYVESNWDLRKQIFFRNSGKYFARTVIKSDVPILEVYREKILARAANDPAYSSIQSIDVRVIQNENGNNYLELRCNSDILEKLPLKAFRVHTYESNPFSRLEDAEKLFFMIRDSLKYGNDFVQDYDDIYYEGLFPQIVRVIKRQERLPNLSYIDNLVDHLRITPKTINGKENFVVKIDAADEKDVQKTLKKVHLNAREKREARMDASDPLGLNSPTELLRFWFPPNMPYDPERPLITQICRKKHPFTFHGDGTWSIERTIKEATAFVLKNLAGLDDEVTAYTKDVPISGRLFMSTYDPADDKKIYATKEFWRTKEFQQIIANSFPQIKFEFIEDEYYLRARMSNDAQHDLLVFGHNIVEFDQRHNAKYNQENALLQEGKITPEEHAKIAAARGSYKNTEGKKPQDLWMVTKNSLLDSYTYFGHRNKLFANDKLATIAGFEKSLSYKELEEKLRSGKIEDLLEIVNYQAIDGDKTRELAMRIIPHALLESLAVHKPLQSVFNANPVLNFYLSGRREYMLAKNTHRDRHEMSFRRHLEKLDNRMHPQDIFEESLGEMNVVPGIFEGGLYYASPVIETFKSTFSPVEEYMYDQMLYTKDVLLKMGKILQMSAAIHVQADKARNFMIAGGSKFGMHDFAENIFKSLNVSENIVEAYYAMEKERQTSDYELSRTGYIYSIEYGAGGDVLTHGSLPYYTNILELNNEYAKRIADFKKKGFIARANNLVVSQEPQDISYGYYLGDVRGVALKNGRMIARFTKTMDGKKYSDVYQGIEIPENETILRLLEDFLDNTFNREKSLEKLASLPLETREHSSYRELVKLITGRDMINRKLKINLKNGYSFGAPLLDAQ